MQEKRKLVFIWEKNVNNIRLDLGTSSDTTFDLNCIKINEDINHGMLATIIKSIWKMCAYKHILGQVTDIFFGMYIHFFKFFDRHKKAVFIYL